MTMNSLPPGFRFHPTDVELIKFYLQRKVMGKHIRFEVVAEIDIYKFAPWDLPDKSCMRSKDMEWYFYCPREKKYSSGGRMNRATEIGYWKTTGKDRTVINNGHTVGMIKTLIFHTGRAPKGDRTDWVMHEYRLEDKNLADAFVVQDAYVLCKIFQKSGPGPKNGAQYGAPFIEEEWSDDEDVYGTSSFHLADMSVPVPVQKNQNNSAVTNTYIPGPTCIEASVSCANTFLDTNASMNEFPPTCDDVFSMLDCFDDDFGLIPLKDHNNEIMNNVNPDETGQSTSLDVNYIYEDLVELGQWKELSEDGLYLELNDLEMPLVGTPNHSYESSFDPVLSHYDLYNISDLPSYPLNSVDTDQDVSTINQSLDSFDTGQDASITNQSLVLPEGFLWR